MERETIRFHKGLRAIVLPDGRRLSSDQKRVFVEPPQSIMPAKSQAGAAPQRSVRQSPNARVGPATAKTKNVDGNRPVPVGPASGEVQTKATRPESSRSGTAKPKKDRDAALEDALETLRARVEPLMAQIGNSVNEYVAAQKIQLQELEKPTLEIALCVAEHVVGQCVDAKQLNMQPLVAKALQQLAPSEKVLVKLNKEDLTALQAVGADLDSLGQHVSVVSDQSLPIGSCVVHSGGHEMASTIRHRLDNARRFVTEEFQHGRT